MKTGVMDAGNIFSFAITGINYIITLEHFYITYVNISQYFFILLHFWSNKCSLGEHKDILQKIRKKNYQPQTFEYVIDR